MKQLFNLLLPAFAVQLSSAQNVGIGTTNPNANALLHVNTGSSTTKGLLVTGTYNAASTVPDLGEGSRLMFYPGKGAFRAGHVTGTQWDNANVGLFSSALGANTTASGDYSTALGRGTTASEYASTALGRGTTASGTSSTAIGDRTTASGYASTAMGESTIASGHNSVAIGRSVSTNGMRGSFFLGDSDPNSNGVRPIGFVNQIAMRFNGGYYFISSDAGFDLGVQLPAGGNSWSAISDARLKENFLPVDGEEVLRNIAALPQYTWNYKGQDVKTLRHYGPMAQDFHKAFGQDAFGTIGCDTLINQQDFLGVNLIAIQALEKRTAELQKENEQLKARLDRLEKLQPKQE